MSVLARNMVLFVLMLGAGSMAIALKPTQRIADQGPRLDLEKIIPKQIADWTIDPRIVPIAVSPDVQAQLDALYEQTVARTYIDSGGRQIMLSIAYGGDQSGDRTQVHRPEFCYAAQGFELRASQAGHISTGRGPLPVRRLTAAIGSRNEPITYWITVGDRVTLPGLGRKLAQLRYGLSGTVPDGMLVRVSSIDQDAVRAYEIQDRFIGEMIAAIDEPWRDRIAGRANP